ncbi:hypothetical protein H0H93_005997, partial [Arthromyces matolae]
TCDRFIETLVNTYGMTTIPTPPLHKYEELREITEIRTLKHGSHKIDVMITSNSCMTPIFSFHSTVVMNCVTSKSIFCAFPYLTSTFRNLASCAFDPFVDKTINYRQTKLDKYAARGYEGRWDFEEWVDIRDSPALVRANHQDEWRTAQDKYCL